MKRSIGTGYLELSPECGDTYLDWNLDPCEIENVFRFDPDEGCWEIENIDGDRVNIAFDVEEDTWIEC